MQVAFPKYASEQPYSLFKTEASSSEKDIQKRLPMMAMERTLQALLITNIAVKLCSLYPCTFVS